MPKTKLEEAKERLDKALRGTPLSDYAEKVVNKSRGHGNTRALINAATMTAGNIVVPKDEMRGRIAHSVSPSSHATCQFSGPVMFDNFYVMEMTRELNVLRMAVQNYLSEQEKKS